MELYFCQYITAPTPRAQKPIYRLFGAVFFNNSRTTEAMSTSRTMQGRASSDLSDKLQEDTFAFEILEKTARFCCFVCDFWQFSVIFNISVSRLRVSIFEAFFRLGHLARTTTNHKYQKTPLIIVLGWNFLGEKTDFFEIWKKYDSSVFRPKPLPIKEFGVYRSKEQEKSYKKEPTILVHFFVNFLSIFQILNCRNFFFSLIWNLVGFCKAWMSARSAIFRCFRCLELEI